MRINLNQVSLDAQERAGNFKVLFTFYIPVPPVEQVCFQTAALHKNSSFFCYSQNGKEELLPSTQTYDIFKSLQEASKFLYKPD